MNELEANAVGELIDTSRSMFERGYRCGTAGNVTVRVGGSIFPTPTGSSLDTLAPEQIAQFDLADNISGPTNKQRSFGFIWPPIAGVRKEMMLYTCTLRMPWRSHACMT
jgi:ribulose-5-phosphate 4-epimerase/fuculose-1-phosphate aldolase